MLSWPAARPEDTPKPGIWSGLDMASDQRLLKLQAWPVLSGAAAPRTWPRTPLSSSEGHQKPDRQVGDLGQMSISLLRNEDFIPEPRAHPAQAPRPVASCCTWTDSTVSCSRVCYIPPKGNPICHGYGPQSGRTRSPVWADGLTVVKTFPLSSVLAADKGTVAGAPYLPGVAVQIQGRWTL